MAMYGLVPVVELQFDAFSYPAFQQIVSHVAKMRNRTRGRVALPITIRIPYGGHLGAPEHHAESPEAYFAHTAGLKVVTPGVPADAYSLLRASIASPDPVVFLEPKRRYYDKAELALPLESEPVGTAVVRRPGDTATVVAYGPTVALALEAADEARARGWSLEVIDLRSLNPLDISTVVASVQRTGRCVVTHEASVFGGFGGEVAAQVHERAFYFLEAPVQRVGGFDVPYPPAKLEAHFLPHVGRVLDAVALTLAA
jgi:pyruvate dehydrogenase E1 component beta subunit